MAENLEYRIGGIDINLDRIRFSGIDLYDAYHKFVVQTVNNQAEIYVACANRHYKVADKFKLTEEIVGGGSCYIDKSEKLVLNDYSGDYKAIPKEAAQKFLELLVPELQKQGIQTNGAVADPKLSKLNEFWKNRGF
jgi:hypothetical protein